MEKPTRPVRPTRCTRSQPSEQLGKVHEVRFYPNVGHGFISRGPREVCEYAWARTLAWFDRYLTREPAIATALEA